MDGGSHSASDAGGKGFDRHREDGSKTVVVPEGPTV
jgi:hypothetical protein